MHFLPFAKSGCLHINDAIQFLSEQNTRMPYLGSLIFFFMLGFLCFPHLLYSIHCYSIPQPSFKCTLLFSAFRHTSVFPPEPHPLAYGNGVDLKSLKLALRCIKPLEVMIQVRTIFLYLYVFYTVEKCFVLSSQKDLGTGHQMTQLWTRLDLLFF